MADSRHGDYVRRAHEATTRHSDALLSENERLRSRVALLEVTVSELERRLSTAEKTAAMADPLRSLAARLESDKISLQRTLADLEEELAGSRRDFSELRRRLESVEDENRRAQEEHAEIVQRSAHLANLYVASYRLHETLRRSAVIEAIQEIIVNLVGSEEFGIFELDEARGALSLTEWWGNEAAGLDGGQGSSAPIVETALSGEVYIAPSQPAEAPRPLTACIPLKVEGRVIGVIAVFRLLAHKPALEAVDLELFDLLAMQAGIALHCTRFHSAGTSEPEERTRERARQLTVDTSRLGGN
jgi:regulator of replication initiation timing